MTPPPDVEGVLAAVPVTVVRAPFVPRQRWRISMRAGVSLRAALRRAFRRVVCVEPDRPRCQGCPELHHGCLLPNWVEPCFRGCREPSPIALRVNRRGQVGPSRPFTLTLTIVGEIPDVSVVAQTLAECGRIGLGRDRIPHYIGPIAVSGRTHELLLPGGVDGWPEPLPLSARIRYPEQPRRCRIRLRSPLRWFNGWPASDTVTPAVLFHAALLRLRDIERSLGWKSLPWFKPPGNEVVVTRYDIRWVERRRGSWGDDESGLWVDGAVGEVVLEGDLTRLAPFLALGEVLQLGRATSAGLGEVELDWD